MHLARHRVTVAFSAWGARLQVEETAVATRARRQNLPDIVAGGVLQAARLVPAARACGRSGACSGVPSLHAELRELSHHCAALQEQRVHAAET